MEACLKQEIMVFTPFADGSTVDLVIIVNGKCLKTQVKSTETGEDGIMIFNLRSSKSTRQPNPAHYYTEDEIDIFLLYSYVYDEVYVLPVKDAPKSAFMLRHDNPKRKYKNMNFAKDYLFKEKIHTAV